MSDRFLEYLFLGIFTFLIFIAAFVCYWIFFTFFPKLFAKQSMARRFLKAVEIPSLSLLLLLSAYLAFNLYEVPLQVENIFSHILLIAVIAAFGFLSTSLVRVGYFLIKENYESQARFDLAKRSLLTQAQFLYRATLFGIVILSFGCILITFPSIKSLGVGILGSAGIAGLALGVAARPILLNLMAGFQIAMTKMIKIGDAVVIEKENGRVEQINLTHVIVKLFDLRRYIVPISFFIDNPFQNWTTSATDLIGVAYLYCDYRVDVEKLRKKLLEILESTSLWDKKVWSLHVTDARENAVQLRAMMSATDSSNAFNLQCYVREKLLEYLQKESPDSLPHIRIEKKE